MQTTVAVLHKYIGDNHLDGDAADLDAETPLLEWGVIDSLAMVELLRFIEDELGVRIPDEDVVPENFATLTAIGRLVAARRAG